MKFISVHCCHCYATSRPWLVICEMLILFSLNKQMILEIINEVSRRYVLMKFWHFPSQRKSLKTLQYFQEYFWTLFYPSLYQKNALLDNIFSGHFSSLWKMCLKFLIYFERLAGDFYLLQNQMLFIKVYEHIMIHIHKSFQSINVSVYSYLKWRKMSEERQ